MPIRLSSIRPENRTIKISELNLHWIGILLLCLSTLSTAVIQRGMLRLDGASPAEMEQIMASGATAQWAVQAMLLTMTATLALPLYAKLLVEAVDQTEDKRRLLLELGGCALAVAAFILPNGLITGGSGVMLLFFQRKEGGSQKRDIAAQAVAVAAAAAWTILLRVHLGALLVLLCALFYFACRAKKEWIALAAGAALTLFYFPAPLGLLLVHWYDNKSRARTWVFCMLYTAQLIVFGILGSILAS